MHIFKHSRKTGVRRPVQRTEPESAASYNETMRKLRRQGPVALALITVVSAALCRVLQRFLGTIRQDGLVRHHGKPTISSSRFFRPLETSSVEGS